MKVVVAGASGALGRALVPQLIAAGHAVIGLSRSTGGAERIDAAGAQAVVADVLDGPGLLRVLAGVRADAVLHEATAIDGMPFLHRHLYPTDALRDRGTANLLRAAEQLGARRFVTQSFFLGYGYRDHGPEPVTEERSFAPLAGDAFDVHMRSMRIHAPRTTIDAAASTITSCTKRDVRGIGPITEFVLPSDVGASRAPGARTRSEHPTVAAPRT